MRYKINSKLFKENKHIYFFDSKLLQPGAITEKILGNTGTLKAQIEDASKIPGEAINGVINEAREKIMKVLGMPFEAIRATGDFAANTVQKAGDVASRVLATGAAVTTGVAALPAALISKGSRIVQSLPSRALEQVLRPFRWLMSQIPFTRNKAQNSDTPRLGKYS